MCIVPMNTFTVKLEEPGKPKLINFNRGQKKW